MRKTTLRRDVYDGMPLWDALTRSGLAGGQQQSIDEEGARR